MDNEDHVTVILHLLLNIICLAILSGSFSNQNHVHLFLEHNSVFILIKRMVDIDSIVLNLVKHGSWCLQSVVKS